MSQVLIVGAGGIGCELLKNTVLSGLFKTIHLVDLDTIELSNLNRQFLFRRADIGKSKAIVAREAALKMIPEGSVEIIAHFANIVDTNLFPIKFFADCDLVMNALDNLAARKYVNSMCLAVNVPLIESGTAGYLGQTSIIFNRQSECFECVPKEPPKTFPVCTIRSTPSAPIHCIVWAKDFLLPNLFGASADSEIASEDSDILKDTWRQEQEAFSLLRELKGNPKEFTLKLLQKVYKDDIVKLCTMDELWKSRERPTPLEVPSEIEIASVPANDQQVLQSGELISLLARSIEALLARECEISFDKDDNDTLDFVCTAANLRAIVFGIEVKSRFDVKAIAGNIIPAIASTNAIAAAMIIIHARNILIAKKENYCNAFINYGGARRNIFTREELCPPNPDCPVCGVDRVLLTCNTREFTLNDVLFEVLKQYPVEYDPEDVSLLEGSRLLYEIDDDAGNSRKTLAQMGVSDSKFLKVDIYRQKALMIGIIDDQSKHGSEYTLSVFDLDPNRSVKSTVTQESDSESDVEIIDSDVEVIEVQPEAKRAKTA